MRAGDIVRTHSGRTTGRVTRTERTTVHGEKGTDVYVLWDDACDCATSPHSASCPVLAGADGPYDPAELHVMSS